MDYKLHYDTLINNARDRLVKGYTEKHHILPRCMGGTNENNNLIILTAREHYVAHQLLVKMSPENDSLVYAAKMMTLNRSGGRSNNRHYKWLKEKYQKVCKKRVGDKNPSYGKSWYYDPNTYENVKCLPENAPIGFIKGKRTGPIICNGCDSKFNRKKQEKYCSDKCYPPRPTRFAGREEELKEHLINGDTISSALGKMGFRATQSNTKGGLGKWAKTIRDEIRASEA